MHDREWIYGQVELNMEEEVERSWADKEMIEEKSTGSVGCVVIDLRRESGKKLQKVQITKLAKHSREIKGK